MQTFTVDEPYLNLHCGLSESPFWEKSDNVLRFVDIVGKAIYRVSLSEGPSSLQKHQYEQSISITANIAGTDDNFVFGGRYGVGIAKKSSSDMRFIRRFWSEEEEKDGKHNRMRANDGAVDSRGRFWVSALCDPEVTSFAPEGALFRLDADGQLRRIITGVTIPNGVSWSKDNRTFYFTDTSDGCVYAYDYEDESGTISNKRIFFKVAEEGTGPDGHAQDENGNLWIAVWGSWKVIKVSPQGEVEAEIRCPTRCVTAVAFADEDVYITSEAEPEPEKYPQSAKYAGGVFKCHVGVRGRSVNEAILGSEFFK